LLLLEVEPHLLSLSGEVISPATVNRDDEARSDIRAKGFWLNQQSAFFDIRIFYPRAQSYSSRSLLSLTSSIEKEKRRQYGSRVIELNMVPSHHWCYKVVVVWAVKPK
jgi:hypothetical protein